MRETLWHDEERRTMQAVAPIRVVHLFPLERQQLLELFSELSEEEWKQSTVCAGWTVKEIGLHLLGDDLGYLAGKRDRFSNPFFSNKEMQQWESLVNNINEANELWVKATQRLSPKLLSDLLYASRLNLRNHYRGMYV
jgi:hypothetical protein